MAKSVLHLGQSNALGRNAGAPAFSSASPLVTVWNNATEFGAGAGTAWIDPVEGTGPYDASGDNNTGLWFCHHLAQRTGEAVRHVLVAKGSTPIDVYLAGGDESGWTALTAVQAAINGAGGGVAPFDVLLWQGSESNHPDTATAYRAKWNALVSRLTTAGLIDAATLILLLPIEIATAAHIEAEHSAIAAASARVLKVPRYVSLATSDAVHWTAASLATLGAAAFCVWQDAQ